MNYCLAQKTDAREIARIHKTEIVGGFLSSLPDSFLEHLYRAVILSPLSFCVVAKEGSEVVGFISGAGDIKKVYAYFLRHYFLQACFLLLRNMLRNNPFSFVKKITETLLYPSKEQSLPKAELLTMAVSHKFQGLGVATGMFLGFKAEMKKRNVVDFKVLVGESLKPAISFYEKNGFTFIKNTSVHGKAVSKIYVYTL